MIQFDSYKQFIKNRHAIKDYYFLLSYKDKWLFKRQLYKKNIMEDFKDLIWEYIYSDISNNELKRNCGKAK